MAITIKFSTFRELYPNLRDAYAAALGDITPRPRLRADDWHLIDDDVTVRGRLSWSESTDDEVEVAPAYRAYDTTTEWQGPPRRALAAAERDAERHNDGCAEQGGHGSAVACAPIDGRLHHLDGRGLPNPRQPIWPPHGQSCGAARAR